MGKFKLGMVVITANAKDTLDRGSVCAAIQRHENGDWGIIDNNDKEDNEAALKYGGRLMSVYSDVNNVIFWIITEADRSVTTILLPEDY